MQCRIQIRPILVSWYLEFWIYFVLTNSTWIGATFVWDVSRKNIKLNQEYTEAAIWKPKIGVSHDHFALSSQWKTVYKQFRSRNHSRCSRRCRPTLWTWRTEKEDKIYSSSGRQKNIPSHDCYYVKMCWTDVTCIFPCSTHFYIIAVKGCFFVYLRNCIFCPLSLSVIFIVKTTVLRTF